MPEICMRDGLVVVDGVPDVNAPGGVWPYPGQETLNSLHLDPDLGLWIEPEPLRSDSEFTEISLEVLSGPVGGTESTHDNRLPYNTAFGVDDPFGRMFHFKHTNPESCANLNRIVTMSVVVTLIPQDKPYTVGLAMGTTEPMSTFPQFSSFGPFGFGDPVTLNLNTSLVTRLATDSPTDFYMLLEVIQPGDPRILDITVGTNVPSEIQATELAIRQHGLPLDAETIRKAAQSSSNQIRAGGLSSQSTSTLPAASVRSVEIYYDILLLGAEGGVPA